MTSSFGTSGLRSVVHKSGAEGAIEIDPISGEVLSLLGDKPEWAEGLTVAQVTQRHKFYSQALGDKYTSEMKVPQVLAFEDLDWLGARALPEDHDVDAAIAADPNYDGFEHFELNADEDFRSGVVAQVLEISGDIKAIEAAILNGEAFGSGSVTVSTDTMTIDLSEALNADNYRSQEELEEQDRARREGFSKVASASGE